MKTKNKYGYLLIYKIRVNKTEQQTKYKMYKTADEAYSFATQYNKEMLEPERNRGIERVLTDFQVLAIQLNSFNWGEK